MPVGRVDPHETSMDVPGLVEGKQYQFRVKAINEEGPSDPLETDHATLAKNPYGETVSAMISVLKGFKLSSFSCLRRASTLVFLSDMFCFIGVLFHSVCLNYVYFA